MEGRVPPSGDDETDNNPALPPPPPPPPPTSSPSAGCHSETYVIQIPKDQIYRVPPPENALIAERHRTPGKNNKITARWSCLLIICVIFLIAVALIGIALVALYFMFIPKAPTFFVEHVLVKKPHSSPHNHPQPGYVISLEAQNPNEFMGISYNHGGVATLSFKGKNIAKGKFPASYQGENSSKRIKVVVQGSNVAVPYQIEKIMKDKKSKALVSLALNVKVPVKMKFGAIKTWIMDTNVACKFKLSKMGVGSMILSQECQTEFKS